jgi:hypothetical protein
MDANKGAERGTVQRSNMNERWKNLLFVNRGQRPKRPNDVVQKQVSSVFEGFAWEIQNRYHHQQQPHTHTRTRTSRSSRRVTNPTDPPDPTCTLFGGGWSKSRDSCGVAVTTSLQKRPGLRGGSMEPTDKIPLLLDASIAWRAVGPHPRVAHAKKCGRDAVYRLYVLPMRVQTAIRKKLMQGSPFHGN